MIRAISSIKQFGIFSGFHWPADLPEFKRFNLIYGWNYSGKTTLSRVFRCLEQGHLHADFPRAEAQLRGEDGASYRLSSPENAPAIGVFNSDFVRENLAFTEASANPILVLGAEDIAKQEALKSKLEERGRLVSEMGSAASKRAAKLQAVDAALTRYARDLIKIPLSKPNYNKTHFEPKVEECKIAPDNYLLDDESLRRCLSVYRATEKKDSLSDDLKLPSALVPVANAAGELLGRVVTANKPIARLKENPAVESWVNAGRPLHVGAARCHFCDQSLPEGLLERLSEHFSADYETLMTELDLLVRNVQSMQNEDVGRPLKGDLYKELQDSYAGECNTLSTVMATRRSLLETLKEALLAKKTKAFSVMTCPFIKDVDSLITSSAERMRGTIAEHNGRTAGFEKKRQEAFSQLEKHYAASFVCDQKYTETLQEIGDLKAKSDELGKKLGVLENEIRELENDLSEAARGADQLNELLLAYFGTRDLQIRLSDDDRFEIVRGGAVAKNLSEGEKTAIAFSYFVTLVQDGRRPLSKTTIIIDDPVSSLDANHLFNTYALVKTQFAECQQLFVATHSFEFYNLIRDWVSDSEGGNLGKKAQQDWKDWSAYYLKRTDDNEAVLEEIPRELLRFKSEYHYLFSTLYHFDKAGDDEFDRLLALPNLCRRFMEAFGGIMIPRSAGLKSKMPQFFPDKVQCERVWKFLNYYSHNTTVARSLKVPDLAECESVVHACLEAVREWDDDYFRTLEEEVAR